MRLVRLRTGNPDPRGLRHPGHAADPRRRETRPNRRRLCHPATSTCLAMWSCQAGHSIHCRRLSLRAPPPQDRRVRHRPLYRWGPDKPGRATSSSTGHRCGSGLYVMGDAIDTDCRPSTSPKKHGHLQTMTYDQPRRRVTTSTRGSAGGGAVARPEASSPASRTAGTDVPRTGCTQSPDPRMAGDASRTIVMSNTNTQLSSLTAKPDSTTSRSTVPFQTPSQLGGATPS